MTDDERFAAEGELVERHPIGSKGGAQVKFEYGYRIRVIESDEPGDEWSFANPSVSAPRDQAMASDLWYLLMTCPTTELACRKLAIMRRALKEQKKTKP